MNLDKALAPYNCFKKYYDHGDPSHDWSHIKRVLKTSLELAKIYQANLKTLIPAVVLHDVVNVPKNSKNRKEASALAANKAKVLLERFDFSNRELDHIGHIILEHSYSRNLKASSIESKILQDADKLDSLGAIGVLRVASVGTLMKAHYYQDKVLDDDRILDDKKYSLDHFETKLFKLKSRLNLRESIEEASKRERFMRSFLNEIEREIQ